ncbi:hypothetical protein Pla52o_53320 [Novipirellula galeiformis]|uniref:DUF58 domain-containing protein n=1 Tax=Novipirellula galeiformis TaxID=2528004 RepID=A0A5C6C1D8_9BACT|nr:DUF58 domain-containing protein [Novipirellula galeiformis]TWU17326.1 hypothetical protein Pla52o_53320 [Novipirellula galeiformis]
MLLRNESLNSSVQSRKVRLTRLGMHFVFVSTFAMLGGALRGFNLLLVVAGILVGALFVQWRWSRGALMALSIRRRLPTEAFAGKAFAVNFEVTNHSAWMSLWLLRVEDQVKSRAPQHEREPIGTPYGGAIQYIAAASTATTSSMMVPQSRGRLTFGPLRVASSFPLDLLTAKVTDNHDETLEVFPNLVTLKRGWQRALSGRHEGVSRASERSGRSDGDFFGLRPYRDGDTLRKIHWRTSARLNEPVVSQYEQSQRYELCVLVDGFLATPKTSNVNVELAISVAASLVLRLSGLTTNRIVLVAAGRQPLAMMAGASAEQKREVLSLLSRLEVTDSPTFTAALDQAAGVGGRFKDLLVVSPRARNPTLASTSDEERRVFDRWLRRRALRWIDVSSAAERGWFEVSNEK